jgi:hypothetical protein
MLTEAVTSPPVASLMQPPTLLENWLRKSRLFTHEESLTLNGTSRSVTEGV